MSNLEDVFLKINQEFAPDLFGDLQNFSHQSQSLMNEDVEKDLKSRKTAHSIGHSTNANSTNGNMDK